MNKIFDEKLEQLDIFIWLLFGGLFCNKKAILSLTTQEIFDDRMKRNLTNACSIHEELHQNSSKLNNDQNTLLWELDFHIQEVKDLYSSLYPECKTLFN